MEVSRGVSGLEAVLEAVWFLSQEKSCAAEYRHFRSVQGGAAAELCKVDGTSVSEFSHLNL